MSITVTSVKHYKVDNTTLRQASESICFHRNSRRFGQPTRLG